MGPLKVNERREFKDVEIDGVERKRSVITNLDDSSTWLEFADEFDEKDKVSTPTLYLCIDRGSIGRSWAEFLLHGMRLRMVLGYDPWHIIEGILSIVHVRAGTYLDKLHASVALNAFAGPWFVQSFLAATKKHKGVFREERSHQLHLYNPLHFHLQTPRSDA